MGGRNKELSRDINASELLDMPVFSVSRGETVGVVRNIVIDPCEKRLLALTVEKKGWYQDLRVIPAARVLRLGADVINIDERCAAGRTASLPRIVEYMHHPCALVGSRLLSEDGSTLGRVERYYLDRESGCISRLMLSGGWLGDLWLGRVFVSAQYIRSINDGTIVVEKRCLEDLELQESVLRQGMRAAGEQCRQAAERSQHWGQNALRELQQRRRQRAAAKYAAQDAAIEAAMEA
ncbi:MAG: PRC-barrel domain-containing protein [Firmicutes bacterium]|nr:PRC-barrel domain-containing protein [Bacillota bacterium]